MKEDGILESNSLAPDLQKAFIENSNDLVAVFKTFL
jgi:hypothetical protein